MLDYSFYIFFPHKGLNHSFYIAPHLQMDVAIKTLRVDAMGHGEQEFMREAKIMVTLNHPCIVKLIGITRGKPMMLVGVVLINAPLSYLMPITITCSGTHRA